MTAWPSFSFLQSRVCSCVSLWFGRTTCSWIARVDSVYQENNDIRFQGRWMCRPREANLVRAQLFFLVYVYVSELFVWFSLTQTD